MKFWKLEVKAGAGDEGTFSGMASVSGVKDRQGDIVMPGAFTKSLAENGGKVPVLYQHNQAMPIGIGEVVENKAGLTITAKLALKVDAARQAWELMKAGVLTGLSIGYEVVTSRRVGNTRQLTEVKLWEVSLVTIPANPAALIEEMKAADGLADLRSLTRDLHELAHQTTLSAIVRDLQTAARNTSR